MQPLSRNVLTAFRALAPFAEVGAPVCYAAANNALDSSTDLMKVCTLSGLPQAKAAEVEHMLLAGKRIGLFERTSQLRWHTINSSLAKELAPLLTGVHLYKRDIHRDDNLVEVVLSKPPAPSLVAEQLESHAQRKLGPARYE